MGKPRGRNEREHMSQCRQRASFKAGPERKKLLILFLKSSFILPILQRRHAAPEAFGVERWTLSVGRWTLSVERLLLR
jgi:hypothetical protein